MIHDFNAGYCSHHLHNKQGSGSFPAHARTDGAGQLHHTQERQFSAQSGRNCRSGSGAKIRQSL